MSKFSRQSSRLSFKRFIGSALVLAACYAAPAAKAQLPAVVTYGSRTPVPLPSGSSAYRKIARDSFGDIFILDLATTARIDEIPVNGPVFTVVPTTDPAMALGYYNMTMTVDPQGNIYTLGSYSGAITKIPRLANGTYNYAGETTVTTSFGTLNGNQGYGIGDMAVDSLGNFYVTTNNGHAVSGTSWTGTGLMMSGPSAPSGGKYLAYYPAYTSGAAYPISVQVDGSGNVFYADTTHAYEITENSVVSIMPAVSSQLGYYGTGTCPGCTSLPTTTSLSYVFLDPSGDVYLGNGSNTYVINNNGTTTTPISATSGTYTVPVTNSHTLGVIDGQGNLIELYGGSLERYGSTSYESYSTGTTPLSTSVTPTATFLFTQSTTLKASGALVLTPFGAAYGGPSIATSTNGNNDGTTCTAGSVFAAGSTCTVTPTVKTQFPGGFTEGSTLYGTSGAALATYNVMSVSPGSAVTIDTGAVSTIGTGYLSPAGIAVDSTGAMYVADPDSNAVYKYPAGSTAAGTSLATGLSAPSGVAIDTGGNIFIADTGNDRVVAISGGVQTVVSTPGYALSTPHGVAVDYFGNLYIADTGNGRVLEVTNPFAGEVTTVQVLNFSGLVSPYAIAFNAYNDIYVADKGANAVYMLGGSSTTASTFSTTTSYVSPAGQITVSTNVSPSLSGPTGIAVDASGTAYVTDSGNKRVVKIGYVSSSNTFPTSSVLYSGLNSPYGIATDTTGDLWYTDQAAPGVFFALRSAATAGTAATIPFGTVATGATGTSTATISNEGLITSLSITSITEPSAPFGGTSNCGSLPATVAPGSSCTLSLTYQPTTTGTATPGTLTLATNAYVYNAGAATTSTTLASLTGDAVGAVATITLSGPTSIAYGDTATFTAVAKDASGNVVVLPTGTAYSLTGATCSSPCTLNAGGTFFLPNLTASTTAYSLKVTVNSVLSSAASVTVGKAPLYITSSNVSRPFDVANSAYAAPVYTGFANGDSASTVVSSSASSTSAVTRLTAYGTYAITPSGGTLLTFGATNYTPVYVNGVFTVTGSVPQSIIFPTLPGFTHGATTYTLTGQSTSGLPLIYQVAAGSATISGNVLTVSAAGTVTITASQPGNSTYAAATSVSRSFTAQ